MRVLVLGASHAEIPLIAALGSFAAEIDAAGQRSFKGVTSQLRVFHEVDYSDVDAVHRLINDYRYDAVLPGCNDFAAITCASLRARGVISSGDPLAVSEVIHLKDRFRKLCTELEIPAPQAVEVPPQLKLNEVQLPFSLPVIVKPTDLTGGKGMTVVRDRTKLSEAIEFARTTTRQSTVIVEEYLPWTLHSASYIILGGVATQILNADEQVVEDHFLVSSATMPSSLPDSTLTIVDDSVRRIISALSLSDGVLHVQFLSDGYQAKILEICRRPPGDLYVLLPMLSAAFDFPRAIVSSQLSIATSLPPVSRETTPTLRLCVIADRRGVFRENQFRLPRDVESVFQLELMRSGEIVDQIGVQKSAILFLQSSRIETLQEIARFPRRFVEMVVT
jgi:formate-dependent phosphoribosylglycinamide formyltransferase (GAR transformylase)